MDRERACELLRERLDELGALLANTSSTEFQDWRQRADLTLRRALGPDALLVSRFSAIRYSPRVSSSSAGAAFEAGRKTAAAVIKGAVYELEVLAQPADVATDASIDPDLWVHVCHLVEGENWAQVASQSTIFLESTLRTWGGRPPTEVGEKLMTAVLGENGAFPLGQTQGERQGWHRLGMGLAMAIRNVDTHRIQDRPDLKRYAFGVLGSASLLLTQLRYEHGNRFIP